MSTVIDPEAAPARCTASQAGAEPEPQPGADDDLFADTLLKVEATIEGSLAFIVDFMRTFSRLLLVPQRAPELFQTRGPRRRVIRPLTFMVVSVIAGGFALRALVEARLLQDLQDDGTTLDIGTLATKVSEAYSSISFLQMVAEALPMTILALVGGRFIASRLALDRVNQRRVVDMLSYSVGLQFSLVFVASMLAMVPLAVSPPPGKEWIAGAIGWVFVMFVVGEPALLMSGYITKVRTASRRTIIAAVVAAFTLSNAIVVTGVLLSVVRLAFSDTQQDQGGK